jgi:signal transduction histidine kinase/BarA-like signal transduction histidine kinase
MYRIQTVFHFSTGMKKTVLKKVKRNKRLRFTSLFVAVAALAMMVVNTLPVLAAKTVTVQKQTVKVGYYYDSDYFYKNESGSYCGYDAEYFYEVSKYTDWQYQYVDFDSFEDALKALETGQIDIMPSLFYSEERAQSLLLSSADMGSVYVTIVVPPSNTDITYNDYAALEGKKVGILEDSVDGAKYQEWAQEQGLSTEVVPMASTEELLQALDQKELTAVAISYLGTNSEYRIIKEFSPMKMYFGMPKDHVKLMDQLNTAMDEITIETPDFARNLYNRYYIANQQQSPVFTEEEKKYVLANSGCTVGLLNNDPPFSYTEKDGSMSGAMVEYFHTISKLSGLNFTFRSYATTEDLIQAVKNREIDIAGSLVYDAVEASEDNLYLTNSYISLALTEVTLKGTSTVHTIAVPSYLKSVIEKIISEDTAVLLFYDSTSECIRALRNSQADAAFINTYCANYYMNDARSDTYNITAMNGISYNVTAGVSQEDDKTLMSVLNRCIRYSSATTMNELLTEYTQGKSTSLFSILNRIPALWLLLFGMIMFSFVIVLILLFISVRKRQKEQLILAAKQNEVDRKAVEIAAKEKTTKERNDFFSNISHDMRTPLNAVIGFMRMSKKPGISEEERNQYVDKAILSGNLLMSLIDDTLVISKANSGKLSIHTEPVQNRELFATVITPIRHAAEKKNITFTVEDAGMMDTVILADKLNVQKIFLNLLSNAVKYTPAGGHVDVLIQNESSLQGGVDLHFEVKDDGIGMSDEFMKHMYEPFIQEKRTGYQSVGTGLGLAIVRQLVDLMGGQIEVHSAENKGTCFDVQLHFEEAPVKKVPFDTALPDTLIDMNGKKILLCEDNALNSEIAVALLKEKGILTTVAENGEEGLHIFADSPLHMYDAILMDVRMPVMDGLSAAKAIRALSREDALTIPIIAMSADAFRDDIQKCKEAGMNGHIAKPVDPDILYRTLSQKFTEAQCSERP